MTTVLAWITGYPKVIIGLIASLLLSTLLGGGLYSCEARTSKAQATRITELTEETGALTHERDRLKSEKRWIIEQRAKDMQALTALAKERDLQTSTNTRLHNQLTEALKHEQPSTLDPVLSDAVSDALCLRWLTANRYLQADGHGAGTAGQVQGDSAATLCTEWRGRLTVDVAVRWIGLLLDYAGEDVLYNAARRWRRDKEVQP